MNASDNRLSVGTRVVLLEPTESEGIQRPEGTVAEVVRTPPEADEPHSICFSDGATADVARDVLEISSHYQRAERPLGDDARDTLIECVFFESVVGSQAHGLSDQSSDRDVRGIFLPPARLHWSLWGVPEQLEDHASDTVYWEIAKFLRLALRASPNILEVLYSPQVVHTDELGDELLDIRDAFLSKHIYQSHAGYALSRYRSLHKDHDTSGDWDTKAASHLIRLLLFAIDVLETGEPSVELTAHADRLRALRTGDLSWNQFDTWRSHLVGKLERAHTHSDLPARPDYQTANDFLIHARRSAVDDG